MQRDALLLRSQFQVLDLNPAVFLGEIKLEYSFGGTDVEAEPQVFWSSDVTSRLIEKVPDARKD